MHNDYSILYKLMEEKTKVYVYLTDTLETYSSCSDGIINENIPIDNLVDEALFKKMIRFGKLTGGGGRLYFTGGGWEDICDNVGIYGGMNFTYKLTTDKLTIEGIYNNFILFKTVESGAPYTVNKADMCKMKIKITK